MDPLDFITQFGDRSLSDIPLPPPLPRTNITAKRAGTNNWCGLGVCTAVKNQGQCGSCWAFTAATLVESAWAIAGLGLPTLSPQQLVDCWTPPSRGCSGGDPNGATVYIMNNGITSEQIYPYRGNDGSCKYNPATKVATVTTVGSVHAGPAEENTVLLNYVANSGPVISLLASKILQTYKGGIITSGCTTEPVDHAVMTVGFGTEGGRDYWLVSFFFKNGYSS